MLIPNKPRQLHFCQIKKKNLTYFEGKNNFKAGRNREDDALEHQVALAPTRNRAVTELIANQECGQ